MFFVIVATVLTSIFFNSYKKSIETHNNNMIEMHLYQIENHVTPSNPPLLTNYCKANDITVIQTSPKETKIIVKGKSYTIYFDTDSRSYRHKITNT